MIFPFALPMVADQIKKLALSLPNLINTVGFMPDIKTLISSSVSQITSASGSVFTVTVSLFSNALNIISVFIFSLYLSFDFPMVKKKFLSLFSDELRPAVNRTVVETEQNLGRWIMGQLFLMLVIGLMSYIGLAAFGVPYALPLAIIAGFLEVVPVLGPIIATIVASVVGFAISPNMGILVIALFFGIQQLENNLLVPKVMQSVAGFNPLVTMVALLVGAKLMGVIGALVAIPLTLVLIIAFKNLVSIDLDEQ
jgi:predicted PurR-regulated permease PerM